VLHPGDFYRVKVEVRFCSMSPFYENNRWLDFGHHKDQAGIAVATEC